MKGVIYQCRSPEARGPVRHQKIPYITGGTAASLFFFFFRTILFFCECRSAARQAVGQERGSSLGAGTGHGRAGADELRGSMGASSPSHALWKSPPSPARLEVGRLRRVGGGLQPPHKRRGSDVSPSLTPSSTFAPLSACTRVHASVCRSDCFLLYNVFFFQCLWAMGLEVKHLLNCCQARKRVIKLPREKIDHTGVNAGERG